MTNQEQWTGLCELASNEQDQDKLGALFEGILLLLEDVVDGLVFVIEPVELGDTGRRGRVVLAKLGFALPLLVAAFEELIPVIHVMQGLMCSNRCAHCGFAS